MINLTPLGPGERGYCLPYQDIYDRIQAGMIEGARFRGKPKWVDVVLEAGRKAKLPTFRLSEDKFLEERIQTASFEQRTSAEYWWVSDEVASTIRHNTRPHIMDHISAFGKYEKLKLNAHNEDERILKRGQSYLFPLQEKPCFGPDEHAIASTKSSLGRLFMDVRLYADGVNKCDLAEGGDEKPVSMYVLVTPLAFDVKIVPEMAMNHIRFFKGEEARLSSKEIRDMHKTRPVLYDRDSETGEHTPSELDLKDGVLSIGVSLHSYDGANKRDSLVINPGDKVIAFNNKCMSIPEEWNAIMKQTSRASINAYTHFAGLFDGFFGGLKGKNAVYEIMSTEIKPWKLEHDASLGEFDFYLTREKTNKPYGHELNSSHYDLQTGPEGAKYFGKGMNYDSIVAMIVRDCTLTLDLGRRDQDVERFFRMVR